MSITLQRLKKVKVHLSSLAVLLGLICGIEVNAQSIEVIRYVRVDGDDRHTGVTSSVDPTNPSGAFATLTRAIDEFDATAVPVKFHPNTGTPITPIPNGRVYIIDVGPGVYSDPSTIIIPDNYAAPGLGRKLIIRGPRNADSPNIQSYPGGPSIREASLSQEAIVQTPYGGTVAPFINPRHFPLHPSQNTALAGLSQDRPIIMIGRNNDVIIEGLCFQATNNNPGNVSGGKIIVVDNVSGVLPGQPALPALANNITSETRVMLSKNLFMGDNVNNGSLDNRGLNLFTGIYRLELSDNRFFNVTWNGPAGSQSRGIPVYLERVYNFNAMDNHFVGNLNLLSGSQFPTIDNAIHVDNTIGAAVPPAQRTGLPSTRMSIVRNHISNIRGTGIMVNNAGVVQDTVDISNNNLYYIYERLVGDPTVRGIELTRSRNYTITGNRIGADFGFRPMDGVQGTGILVADAEPHTRDLNNSMWHMISKNIVTQGAAIIGGSGGHGISIERSRNTCAEYNTTNNTYYSGIHITDANGRMENIKVRFNNISRANRRTAGDATFLISNLTNYGQSGGLSIFSDSRNAGRFNTSNRIYVHNNIIRDCGFGGIVFANGDPSVANTPAAPASNYYNKDIRFNYNILINNDNLNDNTFGEFGLPLGSFQLRQNAGVRTRVQAAITEGANVIPYGRIDLTGNWWDPQTAASTMYGPVDNDNPLNNLSSTAVAPLSNVGGSSGQRIAEEGNFDVVLYSPWLGGRTDDIKNGVNPQASILDDDASTEGYQNVAPVTYFVSMLNGFTALGDGQSIGLRSTGFDYTFYTNAIPTMNLVPTINAGGTNGMINKAVALSKSGDAVKVWRGLYIENIEVPNTFGSVGNARGQISISSVENMGVMAPMAMTVDNNQPSNVFNFRAYNITTSILGAGTIGNTVFGVAFTPTTATNPIQEATVRQVPSITRPAALTIDNRNEVTFNGFRIETTNGQAVNSNGSDIKASFDFNLVEVFPSQRNSNMDGLMTFKGHQHALSFSNNVVRKVAGTDAASAVALNVVGCGDVWVKNNLFDGGQTMSTAVRLYGCLATSSGSINVNDNMVLHTFRTGIAVLDAVDAGVGSTKVNIHRNNVVGCNTQNTLNEAGIVITADNALTDNVNVMFNNIMNNRRAGLHFRSGTIRNVHVNKNSFHNNDYAPGTGRGLINSGMGQLDATGNWWASGAGPVVSDNTPGAENTNRVNSGAVNAGAPASINFMNGGFVNTPTQQQRIINSGSGITGYSPWLGGIETDFPAGTMNPDGDWMMPGLQLTAGEYAWVVGLWNAGPTPSASKGMIQQANDHAAAGDWVFFHDDNYRDNPAGIESVVVDKNLKFESMLNSTTFNDIRVVGGSRVEMYTDFTVRNATLSTPNGDGNIWTFPYRQLAYSGTRAGQLAPAQLINPAELKTLTFTGDLSEGTDRFVRGMAATTRDAAVASNRSFGNIGFNLVPTSANPSLLATWTVKRSAFTRNQQPATPEVPNNVNQAPDPVRPPRVINPLLSPYYGPQGIISVDEGWDVSHNGVAPLAGWSLRLDWISTNDPMDPATNFSTKAATRAFIGNLPGSLAGGNTTWKGLRAYDEIIGNSEPRSMPSRAGVLVNLSNDQFLASGNASRGLFTVYPYPDDLKAYAGGNKQRCGNESGVVLGGNDPEANPNTNPSSVENPYTASGGIPPYTYRWTCNRPNCFLNFNNIANPIATPTEDSIVYTVTVTDQVGYVVSNQTTVFLNPGATADFAIPREICRNAGVQSMAASASGGSPFTGRNFSYLHHWTVRPAGYTSNTPMAGAIMNDQQQVASIDPMSPMFQEGKTYMFRLEVEDSKGCVKMIEKPVTFLSFPVADAGAPMLNVCQDGQVQIMGSASSGTGNYTYLWTVEGARRVRGGVSTSVSAPPAAALLNGVSTATPIFTPNITGTQDVYAYHLRLTVIDANGCRSHDDVEVWVNPLPMADAGAAMTMCYDGQTRMLAMNSTVASMGTAPYTYMWSGNNGVSNNSYLDMTDVSNPLFLSNDVAAMTDFSYLLTVTDSKGCQANSVANIREYPRLVSNAGPNRVTCVNSVFEIGGNPSASGGNGVYNYSWNPRQGHFDTQMNPTPWFLANPMAKLPYVGTYNYELEVTNDIGCRATSVARVVVNVKLEVTAGPNQTVCAGTDLQMMGMVPGVDPVRTPGYKYTWEPATHLSSASTHNPVFNSTAAGTYIYTLHVIDPNGCQGSASTHVFVNPIPVTNAGADVTKCAESAGTISGGATGGTAVYPFGYNYRWTPGEGLMNPFSSTTQVSLRFPGTYKYTLTATDGNNCSTSDDVFVVVNELPTVNAGGAKEACNGASVTLDASVSGGAPGYSYSWSSANFLSDASALQPTFSSTATGDWGYALTATDANGCRRTAMTSVRVLPALSVSAGPNGSLCPGESMILDGAVSGGTPAAGGGYLYQWQPIAGLSRPNSMQPYFTTTVPGTYQHTLTATDAKGCQASSTVTVVVHPNPIANAGGNISVCDGSVTPLNGSASSGSGVYAYLWSPASRLSAVNVAMPSFIANGTGSFSFDLKVVDSNGCMGTDRATVTVNALPTSNAGPDRSTCVGNSITLQASASGGAGGYSFNWDPAVNLSSNSTATPVFSSPFAGGYNYTVTVTDANGCKASDNVTVLAHPNPVADAGLDITGCTNAPIVLSGSATRGTSPYNYSWSPISGLAPVNGQNPTLTVSQAGVYNFTVTVVDANGCTSSDMVSVLVHPSPTADAGPSRMICAGGSTTLVGSAMGGTPGANGYSYRWSPATGLDNPRLAVPSVTLFQEGNFNYTLTVTDANGCSSSSSANVMVAPALIADAGRNIQACMGTPVQVMGGATGGTAPYTYRWTPETNLSNRNVSMPYFIGSSVGAMTYTLEVMDANGCKSVDAVLVTNNNNPMVSAGSDRQICVGSSAGLMAVATGGAGNYSYNWVPGDHLSNPTVMNPMFQTSTAGIYNYAVTISDANGCTSTDVVQVMVNFDLNVSAGMDKGTCRGANIALDGNITGGGQVASFSWSPSTNLVAGNTLRPTFVAQNPGSYTYTLTVTDVNGCTGSDQVMVTVVNPPVADAGADLLVCTQGSLIFNGSGTNGSGDYNYTWLPGNRLSSSNIANPVFASTAPGIYNYTLRITDRVSGCSSEDNMKVEVVAVPLPELVVTKVDVSCDGNTDGQITATARIDAQYPYQNFRYSLDGINYQVSNFFSGLRAGTYTVYTKNETECVVSAVAVINNPGNPEITSIENVTDNSAVVNWTSYNGRGNVRYTLAYRVNGADAWTEIDNIPGSNSSYLLTNLQNNTNYDVQLRSRCNGVLAPNWSQQSSFRTLQQVTGTCKKTSGVFVNQVNGANSAMVSWNGDPTGVCYELQYGLSTANPSTWTTVSNIPANSFTIQNLTPGFTYSARIRTNCVSCPATTNNRSAFSNIINFTIDNMKGGLVEASNGVNYVVYPNPSNGSMSVDFEAGEAGEISVLVFDNLGRQVFTKAFDIQAGTNSLPVDITGNAAGVYNMKLVQGTQTKTIRVILR